MEPNLDSPGMPSCREYIQIYVSFNTIWSSNVFVSPSTYMQNFESVLSFYAFSFSECSPTQSWAAIMSMYGYNDSALANSVQPDCYVTIT
jgi:ABC-type multidrug transport system permease subunit